MPRIHYHRMAWTTPEYSRSAVDEAGKMIAAQNFVLGEFDEAYKIINNWRSSHSYPLQCLKMTLKKRARKLNPTALVAQRIKRIPAIKLKLEQHQNMKLSQMHDIGGCRAVMPGVEAAEHLARVYEKATAKNRKRGGMFLKKYDYIAKPKATGY